LPKRLFWFKCACIIVCVSICVHNNISIGKEDLKAAGGDRVDGLGGGAVEGGLHSGAIKARARGPLGVHELHLLCGRDKDATVEVILEAVEGLDIGVVPKDGRPVVGQHEGVGAAPQREPLL
jgi:hypothetical protein